MSAQPNAAQKLLALLARKKGDGQSVFPRGDAKDLFCLLLLSSGVHLEQLPDNLHRLLGEFALKIGFTARPGVRLSQVVEAYFIAHPLHPELLAEFRRWVKDETGFEVPHPVKHRKKAIRA